MERIFTPRKMMTFQHTCYTRRKVGHGKGAESLKAPSKPILKKQEHWPVILTTYL